MIAKSVPRALTKSPYIEARLCRPIIQKPFQNTVLRSYATQNALGGTAKSSRKRITVINDDGRVQWRDLSTREKAARTTQQTVNFGTILGGLTITCGVVYFMYSEVFSSASPTRHFNRAVDRVRADHRAIDILGGNGKIRAYGEPTSSRRTKIRPLASNLHKDESGIEHFLMHFNVEGSLRSGVVSLHMTKRPGQAKFEYKYLALDVKGFQRIYLENVDAVKRSNKPGLKMFGVNWR